MHTSLCLDRGVGLTHLGRLDAAGEALLNFLEAGALGANDEAVVVLGDGHLDAGLRCGVQCRSVWGGRDGIYRLCPCSAHMMSPPLFFATHLRLKVTEHCGLGGADVAALATDVHRQHLVLRVAEVNLHIGVLVADAAQGFVALCGILGDAVGHATVLLLLVGDVKDLWSGGGCRG